jgi:hypothetical protein
MPVVFPMPLRTYENEPNFIKKYKTEMCKNWEAGYCAFGPACTFAHGCCELRQKPMDRGGKMKKCKQFFKLGYCVNGPTCQYEHTPFVVKRRLPIFEEIEKKGFML